MDTRPISTATLAGSVIAVPPLARNASLALDEAENRRLIRHIEAGGVRTLLYGGNAVLSHVAPSEYAALLTMLVDSAATETLVIPSVGPGFGMMMDQAGILRDFAFPTAMVLPTRDPTTPSGVAESVRRFVGRFGRPAVLYLKSDDTLDVGTLRRMTDDGLLSCIKYGIVRARPEEDDYLRRIIDAVGPDLIVSGMGEQPAVVHLARFGLRAFTSGCVCLAPGLSMALLRILHARNDVDAERLRSLFEPLETLRDKISPVRVLHDAVTLAGLADMGPITPPLSPVDESARPAIEAAARQLMAAGRQSSLESGFRV